MTLNTADHLRVHRDAAEHAMQSALEGISHGNALISKCAPCVVNEKGASRHLGLA